MIKKYNDEIVSLIIDGKEWVYDVIEASVSTRNESMTELSITIPCRSVEIIDEYNAWLAKEIFGDDGNN